MLNNIYCKFSLFQIAFLSALMRGCSNDLASNDDEFTFFLARFSNSLQFKLSTGISKIQISLSLSWIVSSSLEGISYLLVRGAQLLYNYFAALPYLIALWIWYFKFVNYIQTFFRKTASDDSTSDRWILWTLNHLISYYVESPAIQGVWSVGSLSMFFNENRIETKFQVQFLNDFGVGEF